MYATFIFCLQKVHMAYGPSRLSLPTIASGSFATGPDTLVEAVDIYAKEFAKDGAPIINSIQDLATGLKDTIRDLISASTSGLDDFLKIKDSIAEFDPKALADRVLLASSEFRSSVSELGKDIMNGVGLNVLKTKAQDVMCTVNDVRNIVSGKDMASINKLGSFVNQFTGTNLFRSNDTTALGGLLSTVVGKASDLGITGVFTSLTSTLTDNSLINKTVKTLLPIALRNSDIKLLKEISGSPAAKLINVFAPGFSNSLASYYRGTGYGKGNTLNSWTDLVHTLANVDQQWDRISRGGDGLATNLMMLLNGSRDFQKLLITGVNSFTDDDNKARQKNYALARTYKKTTVEEELAKHFPNVALLSINGPQGKLADEAMAYADPRTLTTKMPLVA